MGLSLKTGNMESSLLKQINIDLNEIFVNIIEN